MPCCVPCALCGWQSPAPEACGGTGLLQCPARSHVPCAGDGHLPPPIAGLCCSQASCCQRHACRPTWQGFVPDLLLWRQRPAGSRQGTLQMWYWTWGPSVSGATAAFWRPGERMLASKKQTLLRRAAQVTGQSAFCCQSCSQRTSQQVVQHPSSCVKQACSNQQHVIKAGGLPVRVVLARTSILAATCRPTGMSAP